MEMSMIDYLWEQMFMHGGPPLATYPRDKREELEMLDFYIKDCLEEWFANGRQLCAFSTVRLSNYLHELMLELRRLGGPSFGYFEDLQDLCRRVLRRLRMREARQ
jgi:hypothetical protein